MTSPDSNQTPTFRLLNRAGGIDPALCFRLEGHGDAVHAIAPSPDAKQFVSAAGDGALILWDRNQCEPLRALTGHTDRVHAVVWPTQEHIYSAGADGRLIRWRVEDEEGQVLVRFDVPLLHLIAHPDGQSFIVGDEQGDLLRISQKGELLFQRNAHREPIVGLALSPDRSRIATTSDERMLAVWDVDDLADLHQFPIEDSFASDLAWTPDGTGLICACDDRTIRLWQADNGLLASEWTGHGAGVRSLCVTPDGHYLDSVDNDGRLQRRRIEDGRLVRSIAAHSLPATVVLSLTDRTLTADQVGRIALWELSLDAPLPGHESAIVSLCAVGEARFVSADERGHMRIWDAGSLQSEEIAMADPAPTVLTSLRDDTGFVSGDADGALRLWSYSPAESVKADNGQQIGKHRKGVKSLAVTRDGDWVIAGLEHWAIKCWSLKSPGEAKLLDGHRGEVLALAPLPDGRLLSAGTDAEIILWDLKLGEKLTNFSGHEDAVAGLALLPNGRGFVSGADDGTLLVWDWQRVVCRLTVDGEWLESMLLTSDGDFVLSAWDEGLIFLHRIETGDCVVELEIPEGARAMLLLDLPQLEQNERALLVGDGMGGIHLYTLTGIR